MHVCLHKAACFREICPISLLLQKISILHSFVEMVFDNLACNRTLKPLMIAIDSLTWLATRLHKIDFLLSDFGNRAFTYKRHKVNPAKAVDAMKKWVLRRFAFTQFLINFMNKIKAAIFSLFQSQSATPPNALLNGGIIRSPTHNCPQFLWPFLKIHLLICV